MITNDTLHPCTAKLVRSSFTLAAQLRVKKYTALIFVDTLKSVWGWLLLFLRFTCYYEEYMAHSDSWQEQSCLQRVKGVNKCFWGADIGWDWNIFGGEGFYHARYVVLLGITQYLLPVNTIWQRQVTQIHLHPLEMRLLRFRLWLYR